MLWKLRGEVDKSLIYSRSAKGSTCQRIAFPRSSHSGPEEGCVFSESLLRLELQLLALSHNPDGSSSQKALSTCDSLWWITLQLGYLNAA